MANVLLLTHRMPYPPNKGDKVRSFHLLKHLAKHHSVYLGTFRDAPEDAPYEATLREICADVHIAPLNPKTARLRSLNALLAGEPLTLRYFRDARLQDWVNHTLAHQDISSIVIFCSGMAQYVIGKTRLRLLVDFVDVDSEKWLRYADVSSWPANWLYRREANFLLQHERQVGNMSTRNFFVTEIERELFLKRAPECGIRTEVMPNGVDAEYFNPALGFPSPFPPEAPTVVMTGTMDYRINEEGALWFAREVLPLLLGRWPNLRFYVVGRNPTPALQQIAGEAVVVTGSVEDIRPYLQHATLVVAPIRLARGIQNKILEAMAMAKAVVAHKACAPAIDAIVGEHFFAADNADDFADAVNANLSCREKCDQIGRSARQRVLEQYNWDNNLSRIDLYLGNSDPLSK